MLPGTNVSRVIHADADAWCMRIFRKVSRPVRFPAQEVPRRRKSGKGRRIERLDSKPTYATGRSVEHERQLRKTPARPVSATGQLVKYARGDHDWERFEARWQGLRDKPESIRRAETLADFSEEYSRVKIEFRAAEGTRRTPVVHVKAFDVRAGEWKSVDLPHEHRQSLEDIGIGVAAEEAGRGIKHLCASTPLDRLADIAEVLLAPETLVPKVLGLLAEGAALHAAMPGFAARWVGEAVEQAVSPVFEPHGARGEILAGVKDFAVTYDLGHGQATSAVVDLALDRLADELKKRGHDRPRTSAWPRP